MRIMNRNADESAAPSASIDSSCCQDADIDCVEELVIDSVDADVTPFSNSTCDVHVQTDHNQTVCLSCGNNLPEEPKFGINQFVGDREGLKFYTGCDNLEIFYSILHSLGPAAYQLTYWQDVKPKISVVDQLLLALMKIRTHKVNFEIARFFDIPENDVSPIFFTWIRFMALQWSEIDIWPSKELVRFYAPLDFKKKYPNTRVIVDGVEIPVKKPSKPLAQRCTFSKYKNRNTAKALVGITPGGMVSFISDAYGGSTSDRQITERSSLLTRTEYGDSIMADKGFNVQDLFEAKNVIINIPTFFKKMNRMSNKTVMRDRAIASKRVHVERIIGLAKTYKILTSPLNCTETLLASDILFICFMLVNFRPCIIHRNA